MDVRYNSLLFFGLSFLVLGGFLLAKMSQFVNQSVCQLLIYNGQACSCYFFFSLPTHPSTGFIHSFGQGFISSLEAVATVGSVARGV